MNKVPILFVVFNRPQLAENTFAAIREYAPDKLYIAADGPRKNKEGEEVLCQQTRDKVLRLIDWNCEVHTLLREENVGCGRGVSEALTWMFETEEYGIILEDDCDPSLDFFSFCEELLPLYKEEKKVMQINGFNPSCARKSGNGYYFSHYPKIWGWATWKRAWKAFDFQMDYWPVYRMNRTFMKDFPFLEGLIHQHVWDRYYKELKSLDVPRAWDIQWSVAVFMHKGLCVVPEVNLMKNRGVGVVNATNCLQNSHFESEIKYGKLTFPLRHPQEIVLDQKTNRMDSDFYMKEKRKSLKRKLLKTFSIRK